MSVEVERGILMRLFGSRTQAPQAHREIAARAVVMLACVPNEHGLYDEAWTAAAEDRVKRTREGTAGVRAPDTLAEERHVLVSLERLAELVQLYETGMYQYAEVQRLAVIMAELQQLVLTAGAVNQARTQ